MPSLLCSALIFDLDGVLIDSNDLYERHWEMWAERTGVSFAHIAAVHHGRPVRSTIQLVAPHLDANTQAQAYVESLESTPFLNDVRVFPGVIDLLDSLPPHTWAIATSAPSDFARKLVRHLELPRPPVFITGDDVTLGKPHPMPYLRAAKALDVCADRCVVIEDAPTGIASARAAGAYVIGVLTTNGADSLTGAHAITDSIASLRVRHKTVGLQISWEEALVPLL